MGAGESPFDLQSPIFRRLADGATLKRVRFLLRAVPNDADRQRFFNSLKSVGGSLGASLKHPRWTSYGALEVDAFAPSVQDLDLFVSAIEPLAKGEFTKTLDEPPRFK